MRQSAYLIRPLFLLEIPRSEGNAASKELEYPKKITWPWLKKHVDIKHWFYIAGLAITIFLAGVAFGNSKFYQEFVKPQAAKEVGGKNV